MNGLPEYTVASLVAVVVGRRGDVTWVTMTSRAAITSPPDLTPTDAPASPVGITFVDGALSGTEWEGVVAEAVSMIIAGKRPDGKAEATAPLAP